MESLPFTVQCPKEEIELVKYLYENKLKKVSWSLNVDTFC